MLTENLTTPTPRLMLTAIFDHPSAAQDAATALVNAGFEKEAVRVVPSTSDEVMRRLRNSDPDVIERDVMPPTNGAALGFVAGFLGGGLLGLIMGAGWLHVMGQVAAQTVGPFWAAVIGGVTFGLIGALWGFLFNVPLPRLDPPETGLHATSARTIVSLMTSDEKEELARGTVEQLHPTRMSLWRADNGDWAQVRLGDGTA